MGGVFLVMGCCVGCAWRCCYELCGCVNGTSPTNQCDAKSNKYRFTHLEWSAVHEKNIEGKCFCS